jgi:YD repeat-containing protein
MQAASSATARRRIDGRRWPSAVRVADRAATLSGRRIFLTSHTDPQGHTVEYTYDSNFRLIAVTDALGQVTTFSYQHSTDPNLLTKVTDPFGRFATLGYDGQGRLSSITDAAGMTSTFSYGASDFIVAMTTPYGTTSFRQSAGLDRMLEATDPVLRCSVFGRITN